jgi:Tol biopolymer transport system component
MRLPIIPAVVAATLLGAGWYLFNSSRTGQKVLDVPRLSRLADIEGIETEPALSPDGNRCAVIASGDVWLLNIASGDRRRMTQTAEAESFPAWTPDGKQVTFTRGGDTFVIDADSGSEHLLRSKETFLSWSSANKTTYTKEGSLWTSDANGQDEKKWVDADPVPDIAIRSPRFSPDSSQIAFIKSELGLRGEIWVVDLSNGMARPLVADRPAENPVDIGWIENGKGLAYLTNRAGAYSVWYVDFAQSTINPLTQPLVTMPLARLGMAVWKDRIVLPRHFLDSNIMLSDGTSVAASDKIEFQPATSPDGSMIAYTIADENKVEIWTAGAHGESPTFRTLGREPRFSANGFQIVYTHTDLSGNDDIWKIDIRDGSTERVTDADEIDVSADWSPDGRAIAFASARGGAISIWTTPASGGKRLRINDGGFAPRYSPDSKSILFWNKQALWTMETSGKTPHEVIAGVLEPLAGVWRKNGKKGEGPVLAKPPVDYPVWPGFDMLPDGRFVVAPINIRETALWAIDLTYKEK